MDEEVNILDYIKILKEKWRLWFSIFIIAEFVVLIITIIQPKVYEATATILPPELTGGAGSSITSRLPSILREQIPSLSGATALSQVIIAMLKSRRMSRDVVEKFDLELGGFAKNTNISRSKDGLIIVKVTASTAQLASDIANFYISNLDHMNEELKVTSNKPVVTVLDPAFPPKAPSGPRLKLNLLISGVLALFVGFLLSFFINYLQNIKR